MIVRLTGAHAKIRDNRRLRRNKDAHWLYRMARNYYKCDRIRARWGTSVCPSEQNEARGKGLFRCPEHIRWVGYVRLRLPRCVRYQHRLCASLAPADSPIHSLRCRRALYWFLSCGLPHLDLSGKPSNQQLDRYPYTLARVAAAMGNVPCCECSHHLCRAVLCFMGSPIEPPARLRPAVSQELTGAAWFLQSRAKDRL